MKPDGKRTGEAVILFLTEEDAEKAIDGKNGNTIGERWIDLFHHDFKFYQKFYDMGMNASEMTIASFVKKEEDRQRAVRLRGLPFSVCKEDVVKFFSEYSVKVEDVNFEFRNGRFSGRAIVYLEDEDQALLASEELNRKYIGNRYIEVDPCAKIEHIY